MQHIEQLHKIIIFLHLQALFASFTSTSKPYGKNYGHWTTKWWQWAIGTPRSINPLIDYTGMHASVNQSGDVWFLAGKFGSTDKVIPRRKCTILHDKAILFPILNCEANSLEYPDLATEQDLINHVTTDINSIVLTRCYLNDRSLVPERIQSDPRTFELNISTENPLYLKKTGTTMAAADGYWVFLKPLPVGRYSLEFEGSCENGRLFSGGCYDLSIE